VLFHETASEKEGPQADLPLEAELVAYMARGLSLRDARTALQEARPELRKRDIYQASLRLVSLFSEEEDED